MENMNKYNTVVRQRISDEYVSALKRMSDLRYERNEIYNSLKDTTITHEEYLRLENRLEAVTNEIRSINLEIEIWDKAREICLDVADELRPE